MFSRIGDLGCIRLDYSNKNTGNKILIEETSFNSSSGSICGSIYVKEGDVVQNRISAINSFCTQKASFC